MTVSWVVFSPVRVPGTKVVSRRAVWTISPSDDRWTITLPSETPKQVFWLKFKTRVVSTGTPVASSAGTVDTRRRLLEVSTVVNLV